MKKHNLLITILLPFVLVACGGDGGGVTYTGLTTQAEITAENSKTVVVESISTTSTTSAAQDASSASNQKAINKALNFAKSKATEITESMRYASQTVTDTVDGTCGGSMTVASTSSITETSIAVNVSLTANDYCDDEMIMSGSMNTVFIIASEAVTLKITFNGLKVVSTTDSFTLSGTIEGEGLFASSLVMNLIVVDNNTTEQIKLENFEVTTGKTNVTFSGRIYTAKTGYVDVTTITPMTFGTDGHMTSGSIKFTGASSSSVILSAQTGGGYKMETDTDGDGTIDDTQTGAWSGLSSDPLFGTF